MTTSSLPSATEVSSHYGGDKGRRYVRQRQTDVGSPGYAINADYFLPYLSPTDIVLDFGCGNGGMMSEIQPSVERVDGLEVNEAAREIAKGNGQKVYARISELPSEPVYDVIVTNHVLEHVRDVCATLDQLRARLKPGGKLIAKLPIDDYRSWHQKRWDPDDVDHHLWTWTPRLFSNVLFESGFYVRECRIVTSAWHPKLFPLLKVGLARLAFWLMAIAKRRRQLFAVAIKEDPAKGRGG